MQAIFDYLSSLFFSEAYRPVTIVLEMLLIGLVVYTVLKFLHGTRGAHLLQGLVILVTGGFLVVHVLADQFGLERIAVLYQPFVWAVLVATLVVFQPELRRGLMRLGEARFRKRRQSDIDRIARPIAGACAQLSKNKIGALIAIERDIGLSTIVDQGVKLDARLTPELLNTLFWPGTELHDLGVVIQQGRIAAASCPFPLGDAEGLDRSTGSRHRAAIGLTMDSDALVVVVSEETGSISIAERGRLYRHIPPDALFSTLKRHLSSERAAELKGDEGRGSRDEGTDRLLSAETDEEMPVENLELSPGAPGEKPPSAHLNSLPARRDSILNSSPVPRPSSPVPPEEPAEAAS